MKGALLLRFLFCCGLTTFIYPLMAVSILSSLMLSDVHERVCNKAREDFEKIREVRQ